MGCIDYSRVQGNKPTLHTSMSNPNEIVIALNLFVVDAAGAVDSYSSYSFNRKIHE